MITTDNETGRIFGATFQGNTIFFGFGVKKGETVKTYTFRIINGKFSHGDMGTHYPSDTKNPSADPCEFLGCPCNYGGRYTDSGYKVLIEQGEEALFKMLEE